MKINDLLDQAKAAANLPSDAKLAQELGCSHVVLHNWRNNKGQPDTYAVWRLAEILRMDPREVLAIIEGERAKDEERKEFWQSQMARFRQTTQVLVLAVALILAGALLPYSEVKAHQIQHVVTVQAGDNNVYYVKLLKLLQRLKRLLRLLLTPRLAW